MSKKDELQKLKELQSHNEKSRKGMAKYHSIRALKIEDLEAKIAEEAKFGQLGLDTLGTPYVRLGSTGSWYDGNGNITAKGTVTQVGHLDDLAAMQEDVIEYKSDRNEIVFNHDRTCLILRDTSSGEEFYIPTDLLGDHIKGLQQMNATHLRKGASK